MSRRRRNGGGGGGGGGGHDGGGMMRWLLTYADLITLLMAFFVVLYAMSNVDKKKYEQVSSSLRQALQVEGSSNSMIATVQTPMPTDDTKPTRAQEDAEFQRIIDSIKKNSSTEEMSSMVFLIDERGLVISFLDTLLFSIGRADLLPHSLPVLDRVASAVRAGTRIIRVEGHTDDLPIATVQYPSNWELSAARAITVTRYFITTHNIEPRRLSATGYGEYRPIIPNISDESRTKNRRVDVVVLRASINVTETR